MMQKNKRFPSDLLILLSWTMLTLLFVLIPYLSETLITTILGIPVLLFFPGYTLTAALFPKKGDLDAAERVALSSGLSIAVAPLLGLMLVYISGIKLISLLTILCIFTVILAFIAAYRRRSLPEEDQFSVPFHRIYSFINELTTSKSRMDTLSNVMLIFFIALTIGIMYFVITAPKIEERFTEFYILDPAGKAGKYPVDLKYRSPAQIRVGVVNQEYASVNYTVQVVLDNEILTDTWFRLNHSEKWEKNITFIPDKEGNDLKLEFWLFKEDNFTAPYQKLNLWVRVTK